MSWEALYPGCDVRLEDERPFEVEWDEGRADVVRATMALLYRGFVVVLGAPSRATSLPGEAPRVSSLVRSCLPAVRMGTGKLGGS